MPLLTPVLLYKNGDQEVAGPILAGSSDIIFIEIDHDISSMAILSLPLIKVGQFSVSDEKMCYSTGLPLREQRLLRKSVVR